MGEVVRMLESEEYPLTREWLDDRVEGGVGVKQVARKRSLRRRTQMQRRKSKLVDEDDDDDDDANTKHT
ncbi:hypothetical protein OSB04_018906, partial [Centaurea solstitialis]